MFSISLCGFFLGQKWSKHLLVALLLGQEKNSGQKAINIQRGRKNKTKQISFQIK